MSTEFACGTVLQEGELNNYRYLYEPADFDDHDPEIGVIGQVFWGVDLGYSDDCELYLTESEGQSNYIEVNGGTYISLSELAVLEHIPQKSTPLPLDQQKVLAKATLDKIRLASPKAVVAGGAARCFLQGEQANDIDIFLDLPPYLDPVEMHGMLSALLPDKSIQQLRGGSAIQPSEVTGLIAAYHFFENGQEVQLLVVDQRPDEQIGRFPYSHTQVSWDGQRFKYAPSFDMFLDFKVVVKNYHPLQEAYETKVNTLFQERGWSVAQSEDEALAMAMDSIKLTA